MSHLSILGAIICTVYGQLVFKWQVSVAGGLPSTAGEKIVFMIKLLLNPWIVTSYLAGLVASLCWVVALTRFDLSYAYPFMSLTFVMVVLFSGLLFQEVITVQKVLGVALIMMGVVVGSR